MKDFTVSRFGKNGKKEVQAYIGFEDRPSNDHNLILCYGSALVLLDGTHEFSLGYWFGHTANWDQVTEMILNPFKENILNKREMDKIGNAIIRYIREFISQAN